MTNNIKLNALKTKLYLVDKKIEKINTDLSQIDIKIKLKGSIHYKYIKCGKKNCHCRYTYGHGPYPHLQWWDKGKIKTKYLNKKNLEKYEKELEKNKKFETLNKELAKLNKERENLSCKIRLTRNKMI